MQNQQNDDSILKDSPFFNISNNYSKSGSINQSDLFKITKVTNKIIFLEKSDENENEENNGNAMT